MKSIFQLIIYAFIVIANAKDLDAYIEDTNFNMWKGELPQPKPFGGIQTVEGVRLTDQTDPTKQRYATRCSLPLIISLSFSSFTSPTHNYPSIPKHRTFGMVK